MELFLQLDAKPYALRTLVRFSKACCSHQVLFLNFLLFLLFLLAQKKLPSVLPVRMNVCVLHLDGGMPDTVFFLRQHFVDCQDNAERLDFFSSTNTCAVKE